MGDLTVPSFSLIVRISSLSPCSERSRDTVKSPIKPAKEQDLSIDEADQFTPDNWINRSTNLMIRCDEPRVKERCQFRLAVEWMLARETDEIGRSDQLHYIRNHGSVPHLLWETHRIDVQNGKLVLSMDP
jgi:nitrate reductase (NAD(P)H)